MAADEYPAKSAYRGDVASRYDEDRVVEPLWAEEQAFVREWVQSLPSGTRVLDLPVGTGRFVEFYLERSLTVHGRDISADMIAEVRRRHPAAEGRMDLSVGDAERIDLSGVTVDCVLCWRFFHLIPMTVMQRVLLEFRRICRGEVIVQVFGVEPAGVLASVTRAMKAVVRPLWRRLRSVTIEPETPWSHIQSFVHSERELVACFAQTGWRVRKAVTLSVAHGRANRVYFLHRAKEKASA